MTDRAGGRAFRVAAWMLVGAVIIASAAGVAGGILSRSLVIDLVAMWPILAVAILVGLTAWWLGRKGSGRAGTVLPLAIFTALVLAHALHLGGWEMLPSSEVRLTGPPAEELSDPTEMVIQITGDLVLDSHDGGSAYRVEPILRGGMVGIPGATETSVDGAVSVRVAAIDGPAWYSFSGWQITLSEAIGWRLVLNGTIAADLTNLPITSAAISGSGTIRLGQPPEEGPSVIVAGPFDVMVPAGVAVTVDGEALVPADWETTGRGSRSPEAAGAEAVWKLTVQGDAVPRIREG